METNPALELNPSTYSGSEILAEKASPNFSYTEKTAFKHRLHQQNRRIKSYCKQQAEQALAIKVLHPLLGLLSQLPITEDERPSEFSFLG